MATKTPYYSWNVRGMPKGCQLCVQGKKLVLFVTGLCPRECFYCSISDMKYHEDVGFANERPISSVKDVIEEARASLAEGAGLTGGDPLRHPFRSIQYIRTLKAEFGPGFHIHLYTTPESITKEILQKLQDAGLDEIRLHPDLEDHSNWEKLTWPAEFDWDYGIEIPAIPGFFKNTAKLVKFIGDKIKFINLNELEIADNSQNTLNKRGYFTKSDESYAIEGSEQMALSLMDNIEERHNFLVHYCTSKLKDKVQLGNRIKLRAKASAKPFDIITPEGTLVRGVIYLPGLEPGNNFNERLESVNNKETVSQQLLEIAKASGIAEFEIDISRCRLLCSKSKAKQRAFVIKRLGGVPAIVEEYPTFDAFTIEVDFL